METIRESNMLKSVAYSSFDERISSCDKTESYILRVIERPIIQTYRCQSVYEIDSDHDKQQKPRRTGNMGGAIRASLFPESARNIRFLEFRAGGQYPTREVCEVFRRHPHPNIAIYYGCREKNGRATGLCFKQYKETLSAKVNPEYLNINRCWASGREKIDDSLKENFYGILDGIKHLHSLDLVHNDINPSKIMLDEYGVPVLIYLGSCRKTGESLETRGVGQTSVLPWQCPLGLVHLSENKQGLYESLNKTSSADTVGVHSISTDIESIQRKTYLIL